MAVPVPTPQPQTGADAQVVDAGRKPLHLQISIDPNDIAGSGATPEALQAVALRAWRARSSRAR